MLEKTLQGANIVTCCAALTTAADLTVTGGMASGIGAALSGISLFKKADPKTQAKAKSMATAFDAALGQSHMSEGRRIIAIQMFAKFPPDPAALARGDMIPATIAANMREAVKAKATDPSHQTETALNDYANVIQAVATPLTVPADTTEAMLRELLLRSNDSGRADALRDEGITEMAIIRLARRITAETDNIGQAWLELQNAMDIAVRVQAEGQTKSNHGDFVDTVLARVADLAKDGDYTAAGAEIDDALEQADSQTARLLASGAEVALLDRDTAKAASFLLRKADIEAGGIAAFENLRALWLNFYEIGRDKGSTLDSALAIDLARLILARATTPDERGAAGNDLGTALQTLGERTRGTERLEQAVTAYTLALKERPRDRTPRQWATTQINLGNALRTLGRLERGTERLEQAVTAQTLALEETPRDRVPLDWATAQMNLGNALQSLGERTSGTERLEQAVTAYTLALEENTRDRVPLQWAMTQMNLGNALEILGERTRGTERLEQAVAAYTLALEETPRDHVPLQWAMTQGNLANVELAFFDKTRDAAHLDRAAEYVTAAREVFEEAQASRYTETADNQNAVIQSRRGAR